MKTKYNWAELQEAYDSGLSHGDLYNKYGVSKRAIAVAIKRGDFKSRSRVDARILSVKKHGTTKHTDAFKEKMRNIIISRYENGWMPKAGRCKKFHYISPIAGEVWVDGTWELAVAKWLDACKYNWKRNTTRFRYTNPMGGISFYVPDFWVEELGGFLEIKGYETALDRCKWSQFLEPLVVWKKKELTDLNII